MAPWSACEQGVYPVLVELNFFIRWAEEQERFVRVFISLFEINMRRTSKLLKSINIINSLLINTLTRGELRCLVIEASRLNI